MRSLFTLQRLRHPSTPIFTRMLTTYPRKIPSHVSAWDPSARNQSAQQQTSDEHNAPISDSPDARHDAAQSRGATSLDHEIGHKYAVQRLNRCLSLFQKRTTRNPEWRQHLWRAYASAKRFDPELLRKLPQQAWPVLWNSQSIMQRRNRSARAHVEELYHDMLAVGIAASVDQRIAYLESTFLNGKKQQALEEWEKAYDPLDSTLLPEYAPEYLESGIRMYGLAGNPLRAHEIMHRLFMLYPIRDPDIMKAVFRAYTQSKKTEYHDVAIKIYREAKGRLDTGMTIKDYDCFFVGFLEAGNLIHAKEVYRDMVKDMELGSDPSHEAIEQVLRRLRMLYGLADDIVQTTKVALQAIAILPTAYHSHLFGDWMKLAVTRKAPAAMAQILDMMFTRGYQPETFHFNVLLRTLFRSNEKEYILKAENLGWQMMNEASQGVPTRRPFQSAVDAISRAQRPHPVPTEGPSLPRKVPPANATTIALLMWHHSRSTSGWEHVHYLSKQMETLRIPPNEEVMNVLMDHACRKGDYNKVWDIYHFLTNPANDSNGVFPNGATFRCLWTAMRLCLGDHTTREKSTLPTPRELLAEQIRWWDLVRRRPDSNSFKTGLAAADFGAIYKLIMHSFSAFKDLPGTLVAMHALRWKFGVLPSNNASQILQNQVAWVDAYGVSQEVRTQYAHSGVPGKIFAQMGQIYHILMDARFRRMNITGDDFARMSQKEVGDIDLNLLSEFVRVILKRQYSPGDVEAMIDQAKDDVGVPDMSTGDRDAFAVV